MVIFRLGFRAVLLSKYLGWIRGSYYQVSRPLYHDRPILLRACFWGLITKHPVCFSLSSKKSVVQRDSFESLRNPKVAGLGFDSVLVGLRWH